MSRLLAGWERNLRRLPLTLQVAALMLTVALLAVAILFYNLSHEDRLEIEQLQTTNLVNTAQDLARSLDALIAADAARTGNLASGRLVRQFVSVNSGQRSVLYAPLQADFTNFLASDEFYDAVLLLDGNGDVLATTEGGYIGRNFGASPFLAAALAGNIFVSDPGISPQDRRPVIWLAAPVFADPLYVADTTNDLSRPFGVVVVKLTPEKLWQRVEALRVGSNGYAFVVDAYGIRVAHGRDRNLIYRALAPLPAEDATALLAGERFGPLPQIRHTDSLALAAYLRQDPLPALFVSDATAGAERVYYSAARLAQRDWTVVALLPASEVLAPARRVTSRGTAAALTLGLLLGVTVIAITRFLLRPVPELVAASQRIAAEDLSTPVQVQAGGELGELAGAFESMRGRLQASRAELARWAAELEHRVAQRSQELAALSEVVNFAGRTQSRSELLNTALDQALRVMQAEMGGIWIIEDTANGGIEGRLSAAQGFDAPMQSELAVFAGGEGLIGQVLATGTPIVLADIASAPRLARAIVRQQDLHAFAAVPLRIHGRTLGVLGVFSHAQQIFSPEVVALAESIAQQIALTLDNLALVARVREQVQQMAGLQERERIAADIHDSVAQTIGYLYLQADHLAVEVTTLDRDEIQIRVDKQLSVLHQLSLEIRHFIDQLHSDLPITVTLERILRDELAELGHELTTQVSLHLDGASTLQLVPDTGTELARIVGEAIRNAQRHGRAQRVDVRFHRNGDTAQLTIADDGRGFDPAHLPDDGRSHFGLRVMSARAARIGGELAVKSRLGEGAEVVVKWGLGSGD
ncbi:GAF domain-containing protein [bacterium]|nr:GAF domain-containing protein [bacterium]